MTQLPKIEKYYSVYVDTDSMQSDGAPYHEVKELTEAEALELWDRGNLPVVQVVKAGTGDQVSVRAVFLAVENH